MDQAVAKILSIVALETLEKMAFIFGTTVEDQAAAEKKGEPVTVQVQFRGPFCGALELTISEAVLPELAANMLGIDENGPIGRDHQQDALCEIANVVCGRLLPLIGGRKAEFFIDQPAILSSQSTGGSPVTPGPVARARLDLDDGLCDLALSMDGALPEKLTPEAVEITSQFLEWNTL